MSSAVLPVCDGSDYFVSATAFWVCILKNFFYLEIMREEILFLTTCQCKETDYIK